jgi:uncharacterized protein (TIGR03083 family)
VRDQLPDAARVEALVAGPDALSDSYFAEIAASTAIISRLVADGDLTAPIPTCPEWTLRKLAAHVGRAHRWAAEITGTRSAEFIPFRSVPDGKLPDDQREAAGWLEAGAERVIAAVREAGGDPVWGFVASQAFGGQVPASFWGRRMAHETLVHRADAQLAASQPVEIEPGLAADAIDEWLAVMSGPLLGQPDPRASALPAGATLHVHAAPDGGTAPAGDLHLAPSEWLVSHGEDGVKVTREHARADVAVTGPADRLLLVLMRRLPADDPSITVYGDAGLLAGWLAGTQF